MKEFLLSDNFAKYQARQADIATKKVFSLMNRGKMDEAFGALQMASILLGAPTGIVKDNVKIGMRVKENINRFRVNFIREVMDEE